MVTEHYGAAAFWEAMKRLEMMKEIIMDVHSIQISIVDFISIVIIEPEDFSAMKTAMY